MEILHTSASTVPRWHLMTCAYERMQRRQTIAKADKVPNKFNKVYCVIQYGRNHNKLSHPECVERIQTIERALTDSRLLCDGGQCSSSSRNVEAPGGDISSATAVQLLSPSGRVPSAAELGLVHSTAYISKMFEISNTIQEPTLIDDSTYISPGSIQSVLEGLGAALDLADKIMGSPTCTGNQDVATSVTMGKNLPCSQSSVENTFVPHPRESNSTTTAMLSSYNNWHAGHYPNYEHPAGFAIIRPPGHHVLPNRPMGFGLINTISILARYCQCVHKRQRILIFDFDVHHGNGTMEIFYEDADVMYISTHQEGLWPYTGKVSNVGQGKGLGTTINIPLPGGSGDMAMRAVFDQVLGPAAEAFQPEVILVSAGYDSHKLDPLACMNLKTSSFGWMSHELSLLAHKHCEGRLIFILEGGYHLPSLADSVVASLKGLLHDSKC
ncbi:hypothetical protein CEUSTIGMA_g3798.t1 [Chlamydomonas eustigma]|uniref:Histone deacetylase domain-containing protein n=1 Tax=Chlamydomonas eustigma TaxID=1157962 RepID=A0A250X0D4_9CHLO|nr:hypothetical protein CEUSTIGMA_g3798.t1 [Chlamydomonas eustigma]|eukprot:GAX76352.1 hypothetical protein CEUSTIGMA_g3798.t1 [Chlamydomonas eustigma]